RTLAEEAARAGAWLVHYSTDYVFDGSGERPWRETDAPRPINVYGRTKLLGEHAVTAASTRAFIIRTSWIYGPGQENFLGTVAAKLKRGEPVQAIGDTWASTTYVADLAHRVREIIDRKTFGTYHVVNDGVCSYESFARCAAELADVPPQVADRLIEVVSEASMGREAPRPPWTPMRCLLSGQIGLAPLRSWEQALAVYVAPTSA
ncbi:MAG: SDR family oxidoreductase, partial [Thermoanaerobaculia bacterium]